MTHLKIKDKAPPFDLPSTLGKNISLETLEESIVVLYFYPKDDTPGCTVQAQDFTLSKKDLLKHDAIVVGISKDNEQSHKAFCKKHNLDLILASDLDASVCQAYGVWKERSMYGKTFMGIERTTFVIVDGVIEKIFPKVKIPNHAQEVLRVIKSLEL